MGDEARLAIWRALVDEAERHRLSPTARWSLGEEYGVKLMALADPFADTTVPERHARLMQHRVLMPGIAREDHDGQRAALLAAQEAATTEVFGQAGLPGLIRLAEASRVPRAVGFAHAAAGDVSLAEMLGLLGSGERPDAASMAAGWISRRLRDTGDDWLDARLAQIADLSAEGQTVLLLHVAPGPRIWTLLDELDQQVSAAYWKQLNPYAIGPDNRDEGVDRLLAAGRPWAAVELISAWVHGNGSIDVDLADRVLRVAAQSDDFEEAAQKAWEVGQVLDAMERSGAEADRLALHEFTFFALLDDTRAPRALSAAVASTPQLFVDLVATCMAAPMAWRTPTSASSWLRTRGRSSKASTTCPARATARSTSTRFVPGSTRPAGYSLMPTVLPPAMRKSASCWPALCPPQTASGPPEPVRDVIEQLGTDALVDGLATGRMKQNGVTTRGPYDGGTLEHRAAASLRDDATKLDVRWPRTARMLRSIASEYEFLAEQLDRRAQHAADDG